MSNFDHYLIESIPCLLSGMDPALNIKNGYLSIMVFSPGVYKLQIFCSGLVCGESTAHYSSRKSPQHAAKNIRTEFARKLTHSAVFKAAVCQFMLRKSCGFWLEINGKWKSAINPQRCRLCSRFAVFLQQNMQILNALTFFSFNITYTKICNGKPIPKCTDLVSI